jgi:hypothetical protein
MNDRPDPVERDRAARRSDEQRAVDAIARHLRWHHEAGGKGLTLEEVHAKVATTRYGTDATRRRLQTLVDAGRAHKVVVDQVAIWRHGTESLPDEPETTADRVLEAVKTWPTWAELEAAVGLRGFDLGEITTPLEREGRLVRRMTFRTPGVMAWLPTADAGKALTPRELQVLLHLEALPTTDAPIPVLRGEATDLEGWTSVTATRERLQFTHSAWSYVTGNGALGAELRARTLGGPLLERRGATTAAQIRLTAWSRQLLAELRERGLLLTPCTTSAVAGGTDERELEQPSVGESDDVAGDGLVQPPPLDPPRVDAPVVVGDASNSGREGTDEDGVAGDDTPTDPDRIDDDLTDPNRIDQRHDPDADGFVDVTRWGLDDDGRVTDRPQLNIGGDVEYQILDGAAVARNLEAVRQAVREQLEVGGDAEAGDDTLDDYGRLNIGRDVEFLQDEPELTLADWPDVDTNTDTDAGTDPRPLHVDVDEWLDPVGSIDAQRWADAFVARHEDFDRDEAVGWFSNAIMAGMDEGIRRGLPTIQAAISGAESRLMDEIGRLRVGLRGLRYDAAEEATRAAEEATRAGREGAQLLAALLANDLQKLGASLAGLEQRLRAVDDLGRRVELLAVTLDRVERHVEELRARPPVADAFRRLLEVA